jgi:hypothetical protein
VYSNVINGMRISLHTRTGAGSYLEIEAERTGWDVCAVFLRASFYRILICIIYLCVSFDCAVVS